MVRTTASSTPFAVVAGSTGGKLTAKAVIVIGIREPDRRRHIDGCRQLPGNPIEREWGGGSFENPAQVAPTSRANVKARWSPGVTNVNTSRR